MSAIGRNDHCPCGSGKKFKKCCLPSASSDDLARMTSSQMLKRRVQSMDPFHNADNTIFFQDPKGVRKMSEIILEFAGPLLEEAESSDDHKKAILLAVAAWNLGLDEESEVEDKVDSLVASLGWSVEGDIGAHEFREVLLGLIHRKRKLYGDVKRFVMDCDLVKTGRGFHLNVVSSLLEDDAGIADLQAKLGIQQLESGASV